jgi:predicted enzyme related to lactoylglutathione lyase
VVATDALDRTCAAVEAATGAALRRVRAVGEIRQGFHRLGGGGLIVEVVERTGLPTGPASFWGLVINVEDLDAAAAQIGPEGIGDVTDAVQPGRRIATVRAELGLGVPVALMTP